VSTASSVPETWELTGDDARKTLRTCGRGQLVRDAFVRLRVADGFSHARSLAYTTSLVLVQAIIGLVGLASALGTHGTSSIIVRTLKAAVPGPGGELLTDAVTQAHDAGVAHRYLGLTFGLIGSVVTGATTMGQLERGFNRIYGVEQDRPSLHKYGLAALLAVTAGALGCVAFAALALGNSIGDSIDNEAANAVWAIARWPVALVLVTTAITLLLRYSPRRRQPSLSWLAFGAGVSALLWVASTLGLGLFFTASTTFGKTYGPLAGVVALLIWALLSSISLLYGAAIAAQLEAVRAGVTEPQDDAKVEHSEPDADRPLQRAGSR
jgi:YihY family inner membrane protein